jgi:hypothetical protein
MKEKVCWAPTDWPSPLGAQHVAPAPSEPRERTFCPRHPAVYRPFGLFAGPSDLAHRLESVLRKRHQFSEHRRRRCPPQLAAPALAQRKVPQANTRPVVLPLSTPPPRIEGASDASGWQIPADRPGQTSWAESSRFVARGFGGRPDRGFTRCRVVRCPSRPRLDPSSFEPKAFGEP